MPRTASGQKEDAPLEFRWGTFCRQVVCDAINPQDVSLIGVLEGLALEVETLDERRTGEVVAMFWVHAVFRYLKDTDVDLKHALSAKISQPNRADVIKRLDFFQKPKQLFIGMNIQIPMNVKGKTLLLLEGKNMLKISFRYKSTDLGFVELPIDAAIKVVPRD